MEGKGGHEVIVEDKPWRHLVSRSGLRPQVKYDTRTTGGGDTRMSCVGAQMTRAFTKILKKNHGSIPCNMHICIYVTAVNVCPPTTEASNTNRRVKTPRSSTKFARCTPLSLFLPPTFRALIAQSLYLALRAAEG